MNFPKQISRILFRMASTCGVKIPPPRALFTPLTVPQKLLLGPGPANASPRILGASALPLLGHLHPEFVTIMDEVKAGLKYAFQTRNEWTLAISGTGHAGMEAAILNLVERGDVVLVCVNGIWGERASALAERLGAVVKQIRKPVGEAFTTSDVEQGLREHSPSSLFVAHSESSGGFCQPIEGWGPLCHRYDCLLIVDTVASLGGVPFYSDDLEVDVVYSGSQKVLSSPPGTAPISFSPRARSRVLSRKTKVPSFYFDMVELANYWGCDEGPRRYHHTAPISSVYALREGLALLAEEGLENSWKRHSDCAQLLWDGLEKIGLNMFVKDKRLRLPTVSTVCVPDGVQWKEVIGYLMKKYRVEISGGLGPTVGKVWRIGLMGVNCNKDNVNLVLRLFKEALDASRGKHLSNL